MPGLAEIADVERLHSDCLDERRHDLLRALLAAERDLQPMAAVRRRSPPYIGVAQNEGFDHATTRSLELELFGKGSTVPADLREVRQVDSVAAIDDDLAFQQA